MPPANDDDDDDDDNDCKDDKDDFVLNVFLIRIQLCSSECSP